MRFGTLNQALATIALVAVTSLTLTGAAARATTASGTTRHPSLLQREVNAIHDTGVVGVLASVTGPAGRRSARAGLAAIASRRRVPLDAEFRIASVTKTFVAAVVLQLAGEHRLSLDDTVARWLPGVVRGHGNNGRRVTIRELLQMTSGIFDYVPELPVLAGPAGFRANRLRTYTAQQLVALAMRHRPLFAPGTSASYSNTSYVLLGMIIRRVTGRSWASEVRARILRPLGLRHTRTPGTFPFIRGPHAEGYSTLGGDTPINVTVLNPSAASAAGSMISTTGDLSRFYLALADGRLLAPAQRAEMEATIAARYGLGLDWFPLPCGGGYFGHAGGLPGYNTWDAVTPRTGRTVVISITGDEGEHTQQAINTLVDRQFCRTR
jgi:D-alanyl-D-alanine carboxypeptidase